MIVPENYDSNLFLTNSINNGVLTNIPNANFIAMISDSITSYTKFSELGEITTSKAITILDFSKDLFV